MKSDAARVAQTPISTSPAMLVLLILVAVVMLVVETGSWIPPKKEPAKPEEKKGAPLPTVASAKR
jgi:hypothetical protein